jgi:ABC-2 type transport system ATP-binding protein
MDEAEMLCDRVAIMDNGKIIALDKPKKLIKLCLIEALKRKKRWFKPIWKTSLLI